MAADYELVAGLEVHAQLATRTKLFCACPTDGSGAVANTKVCPICTGQPGVLPVLNKRAVELAFSAALALDCELAPASIFARKNYFYPDLPKAYQISQYEQPFSSRGGLDIRLKDGSAKRIRIHRIHLEEDAGKLLHAIGSQELDYSLVDFNRGGTPLIEIVTEPDFRSSEEAYAYLTALKEVIQYAGASRCDMEKGEMRCDANLSVRVRGTDKFGTRTEIKNLNSFKNVKDAMDYEFRRQVEVLESGGKVVQETRLWDAARAASVSMRSKEEAHDYRYFPDPDLVPLAAEPGWAAGLKASLPELPAARRARFVSEFKLSSYEADVLVSRKEVSDNFGETMRLLAPEDAKTLANLMINTQNFIPIEPERMASLAALCRSTISVNKAKELYPELAASGQDPKALVAERGLAQVSDEAPVREWVRQALAANPKAAEDLRGGKERAIGSIVGAVMKLSGGKANPALVNRLIKEAVKP